MDSYSAFFDNIRKSDGDRTGSTGLDATLAAAGVRAVVVSGVASDFCVGFTSLDALSLGLTTFVAEDLTRGVADGAIRDHSRVTSTVVGRRRKDIDRGG